MSEQPECELCGEPMPAGEEMFKYHGFSGPCPKPHLPKPDPRSGLVAQLRAFVEKWRTFEPDEFRNYDCADDLEDFIKTLIGSLPQQEERKEEQQMVRAKLRVESIEGNKLVMQTVYEPDASKNDENARFTKATPWGRIEMGIDNQAALDQFKVGSYYYADFHEAPQ